MVSLKRDRCLSLEVGQSIPEERQFLLGSLIRSRPQYPTRETDVCRQKSVRISLKRDRFFLVHSSEADQEWLKTALVCMLQDRRVTVQVIPQKGIPQICIHLIISTVAGGMSSRIMEFVHAKVLCKQDAVHELFTNHWSLYSVL